MILKDAIFIDGKCFFNGTYYGDVVFSNGKIIQVECKNGNRYMNGQIITISLISNQLKTK